MSATQPTIKRYRQFQGWDYSRGASLFITIATSPRRAAFGRIEQGQMRLSPLGQEVEDSLVAMPAYNPGISLFGHVVMPDHVHFNVHIEAGLNEPLKVLGNAIRRFKNHTTKLAKLAKHSLAITTERDLANLAKHSLAITTERDLANGLALLNVDGRVAHSADGRAVLGQSAMLNQITSPSADGRAMLGLLWQQGYHDRLCLTREFIDSTERYIAYNPLKWELMHGGDRALAIHEPLDSPRLDAADYWKGVGNVSLLDGKLVALRISRRCSAGQISEVVSRMNNAIARGYVIISGFISPGEKAVRDSLCVNSAARFIRILPSCIPNARFKPDSRYVGPFAAGRYLEIGKGNDEVAFSRSACLDYNAEIVEIAHAGEGFALYWKDDGVHRL